MVFIPPVLYFFFVLFFKRVIKNDFITFGIVFCSMAIIVHYRNLLSGFIYNNCAIIINVALGLFVYMCGYLYGKNNQFKVHLENGEYSFDFFLLSIFMLCDVKYYWNYRLNLRAGEMSSGKWMLILWRGELKHRRAALPFRIRLKRKTIRNKWLRMLLF